LFQYQGVSTCFSQLCILKINLRYVPPTALFDMAEICQNIIHLDILNCNEDNVTEVINFIDIQRNFQSLYIDYKLDNDKEIYRLLLPSVEFYQLSKMIEKKAATIKKFIVSPIIIFLPPIFLSSLTNLQHLELDNKCDYTTNEWMGEWNEYLPIASFPNLQYLKTYRLTFLMNYKLIEKSHKSISEIDIFQVHNFIFNTKELIILISKYCLKIERLTINIEYEDLKYIKEIFLNCTQLKMIKLLIKNKEKHDCNELLEILTDYSPENLCEFSFFGNWIFTIEDLEKFFKNWGKRKPLIFNINCFTDEQKEVVKKYLDKGVIKKSNLIN
jgi:hypothetical protein